MKNKEEKPKEFLVFCKNPEDYNFFDLRGNKPILYGDFDETKKIDLNKGSMVVQEIDTIKFNGSNTLDYFPPNNIGVLLSTSQKYLSIAKQIYEEKINPNKYCHSLINVEGNKKVFLIEKSKMIYDFIENIQICIVFGYTALESFANLSIPEKYEFEHEVKNKGIYEIYPKEAIEKWINLDMKLSIVLPEIYETEEIKKKSLWSSFKRLESLRHDIIHQKSIKKTDFYKEYFKSDLFKICLIPQEIMHFFYKSQMNKNITNPLWPWLVNKENTFTSAQYNSENFEITGNIYEGRKNK